jgi:hypothetical protein
MSNTVPDSRWPARPSTADLVLRDARIFVADPARLPDAQPETAARSNAWRSDTAQ